MVAAWLLLAVVGGATFAVFGGSLVASDDFVNKPESKQVEALVAEEFPGTDADTEIVVVHSPDLTTDDGEFLQRVGGLAGDIRAIGSEHVASVFSYVDLEAAKALQDLLPGAVPGTSRRG